MTEYTFDDLAVMMGTYNEEQAIGPVLVDIDRITDGRAEVACANGSDNQTPEIAWKMGARVIEQESQGYGVVVGAAVLTPDRPVVVITDCDDTYPIEYLPKFPDLVSDGYDVVSGDRITKGAETMSQLNHAGNIAFARLASFLMGAIIHDTTTGMRAYHRELLYDIEWTENTGLSAELLIRPATRGYNIAEVPIPYRERTGKTKLDPFAGGAAIEKSIIRVCLEERLQL